MTKADAAILSMTERDIERFLSKVNREPGQGPAGECHLWTASVDRDGYGQFGLHSPTRSTKAHRIAYFLENGELPPPGAPLALHSCDTPALDAWTDGWQRIEAIMSGVDPDTVGT